MEKPAPVNFDIHPLLQRRWSPRAFSGQPVEKEKLNRIFEAVRWTPSAMNEQPWRLLVGINNDETWEKIFSGLVEFNQQWTRFVPVLILVCGKKNYSSVNEPNPTYQYDVGQAIAHLTFQAMSEEIFVHQMSGIEHEVLRNNFAVPVEYEIISVVALGYPGDPSKLEPRMAKGEYNKRIRNSSESFIFSEIFGNAKLSKI